MNMSKDLQVDIRLPDFVGLLQKRAAHGGAGIVHQNVDGSQIGNGGIDHALAVRRLADIAGISPDGAT